MEVQWRDMSVFIIVSVIDLDYNGVWREILLCDHSENVVPRFERRHTHIAIRVYTPRCVIAVLVHALAYYGRIVFLMHDSRRTWSLCASK